MARYVTGAITPSLRTFNGTVAQYAIPIARIARCRAEAYDDELGRKVWAALGDAVKEQ